MGTNMDAYVTREPIDRELRRRHLAQRLVAHRARTQTIFRLTGLSRHQLATLRRRWRVPSEMRHRGPPPKSFTVFLSNHRVRDEAAALAVFWRILAGVGANEGAAQKQSMIEVGECLCDVLEAYLACFPNSGVELEHIMLLSLGIVQADSIALSKCGNCTALLLVDLLTTRRQWCAHCQHPGAASPTHSDPARSDHSLKPVDIGEGVQQDLF